jgi:hypothetical protein
MIKKERLAAEELRVPGSSHLTYAINLGVQIVSDSPL